MRTIHVFATNDNADIISTLPVELCGLIVSFLTTKEAVATSILSRNWRYIFASSPSLDFDCTLFPRSRGQKQAFINFVNRTIELFNNPALCRFRLCLEDYETYELPLEEWIGFAVSHKVKVLDISLPTGRLTKVPDTVFSCNSLTDLKLSVGNYETKLPLPVGLEKLRTLEIKVASLGVFIKALFENCPLLEELVIVDCKINVLEIDSQMLMKLTICRSYWIGPVRINVSAPGLRCLTYDGKVADHHHFEPMEFLDQAMLNLAAPVIYDGIYCTASLLTLLQMVGNAKVLTLCPWCIKELSQLQYLPRYLQGQRVNVRELVLLLERRDNCVMVITPFLVNCPSLEHLSVYILPSQSPQRAASSSKGGQRLTKTKCAMKQIKTIELEYIDESKNGLELVRFLLKNSPTLEKMKIIPSRDGLEHVDFRRKVSKFERASRCASVEYCKTA